jgi:hypothetical protein
MPSVDSALITPKTRPPRTPPVALTRSAYQAASNPATPPPPTIAAAYMTGRGAPAARTRVKMTIGMHARIAIGRRPR